MKTLALAATVLITGFTWGGIALAHPTPVRQGLALTPRIPPLMACRHAAHIRRIHAGLRRGELSRPEAALLLDRERRLARHLRCACAVHGRLGPRERHRLGFEFDRLSRQVWRQRLARERWF